MVRRYFWKLRGFRFDAITSAVSKGVEGSTEFFSLAPVIYFSYALLTWTISTHATLVIETGQAVRTQVECTEVYENWNTLWSCLRILELLRCCLSHWTTEKESLKKNDYREEQTYSVHPQAMALPSDTIMKKHGWELSHKRRESCII